MFDANPPLAVYLHLPWCEQKCPYCDFNSHQADTIPETAYIDALLRDLEQDLPLIWGRSIDSIFLGGGTPSLFSASAIDDLFSGLRALLNFAPSIEITMESNPGSADADNYRGYFEAGVNRLSIGVQSFDNSALQTLGRIHDAEQAERAYIIARDAGFDNINLDLMFGLPAQSPSMAAADLARAIALAPEHISHYQLTIEPNTLFHHSPPPGLPDNESSWQQLLACQSLLRQNDYRQYEVSAYCQSNRESRHNLNYWRFGDYIGIGAGAHGKITLGGDNRVIRRVRQRQPRAYLAQAGSTSIISEQQLDAADLCFEFMLNALRLTQGFEAKLFHDHTGLGLHAIFSPLQQARERGMIDYDGKKIVPTELGYNHLNELQMLFLQPAHPTTQSWLDSTNVIIHN